MRNKNDMVLVGIAVATIAVMWVLSWLLYK